MASAAAALAARARREIQHQFFAADAVRPDRAIEFTPANGYEERQFARLRNRDIVRETTAGRYWLDLPAYDICLRERQTRVRGALIAVVAILALLLAVGGVIGARLGLTTDAAGHSALPARDAR